MYLFQDWDQSRPVAADVVAIVYPDHMDRYCAEWLHLIPLHFVLRFEDFVPERPINHKCTFNMSKKLLFLNEIKGLIINEY